MSILLCLWVYEEDQELGCWKTSCDNAFVLNDGTPRENGMKFCPYCGQEIDDDPARQDWDDPYADHLR